MTLLCRWLFGAAVLLVGLSPAAAASASRARGFWRATARQLRSLERRTPGAAPHRRGYLIGAQARTAIIGGSDVTQGDWGFMAFVAHFDQSGNPEFSCSGTLISSNVVLTAGHCAVDEITGAPLAPDGFRVVTGSVDYANAALRQISTVRSVAVNPQYDRATAVADAALLVLSTPISAPTVPLAGSGQGYLYDGGAPAAIAGWGLEAGGVETTLLQSATTAVQGPGYCTDVDPQFSPTWQTCTVDPSSDATGTCNGDSGGPLIADDVSNNPIEIAITSLGPTDCNTSTADYFTRTDQISAWASTVIAAAAGGGTPPPPVTTPPPATTPSTPPALTMSRAQTYAWKMVKDHTRSSPKLTMGCTRTNAWTLHCSLAWRLRASSYAASGKFFHYLQAGSAYWWYDFAGTRTWSTCVRQHGRSRCTTHHQHFRWH